MGSGGEAGFSFQAAVAGDQLAAEVFADSSGGVAVSVAHGRASNGILAGAVRWEDVYGVVPRQGFQVRWPVGGILLSALSGSEVCSEGSSELEKGGKGSAFITAAPRERE